MLSTKMNCTSSLFSIKSIINTHRVLFQKFNVPNIIQCAGLKKQTIEEKLGYAAKPKKPLTPYFRFLAQIRPQLKEENPDAKFADLSRIAASKWEKAEESIKSKLEEEYKKEQQAYVKQRIEYEKTVTDEQKDDINHYKAALEELKMKRELKKQMRAMGKPKRPIPSFLRFLKEQEPKCRGDLSFKDWQLKASELWDKLETSEKKVMNDEFSKQMEEYRKALNVWEEKMIRLGHVNMVRSQALIHVPTNRSTFANMARPTSKSRK